MRMVCAPMSVRKPAFEILQHNLRKCLTLDKDKWAAPRNSAAGLSKRETADFEGGEVCAACSEVFLLVRRVPL